MLFCNRRNIFPFFSLFFIPSALFTIVFSHDKSISSSRPSQGLASKTQAVLGEVVHSNTMLQSDDIECWDFSVHFKRTPRVRRGGPEGYGMSDPRGTLFQKLFHGLNHRLNKMDFFIGYMILSLTSNSCSIYTFLQKS